MSLNLHAITRGAIQTVNADTPGKWLASTGSIGNADGSKTPTYAAEQPIMAQVQPPSSETLQHAEFLNIQGAMRDVWMYGNPQAIVRVDAKGGDLLQFPQNVGASIDNWLVFVVHENGWSLTDGSWSHVGVVLQTDRPS